MDMKIAVVNVTETVASAIQRLPIPKGIVGAEVQLIFEDNTWGNLNKTVVFEGSGTIKDVLNAGQIVKMPWEVASEIGSRVRLGVAGTNSDGTVVIPTLWTDLGRVWDSADPAGDESADPSLPVWGQLDARIKKLENRAPSEGGGVSFEIDEETLTLKDGVLSVNTTNDMEQDNTRPITSAGVFATVGNIEALLKTI